MRVRTGGPAGPGRRARGVQDVDTGRRAAAGALAAAALRGAMAAPGTSAEGGAGRFIDFDPFPWRALPPRPVRVWLPPGYDSGTQRYGVLYLHDGQNVFDTSDPMAHGGWQVDRALAVLIQQRVVRPTIIVAVWNSGADRFRDYGPQAALQTLPEAVRLKVPGSSSDPADFSPRADAYLRCLVDELKPAIDARLRTRPGRDDTVVMGSSMGGVVSLYALCRYPGVFGAAGCMSTHWPLTIRPEWLTPTVDPVVERVAESYRAWLATNLPIAGTHRLYFDHGDQGLDALYPPHQAKVDTLVAARGYRRDVDWVSRAFPGTDHHERDWRARLDTPLRFLLSA